MTKAKLVTLVIIGLAVGFVVFWVKKDADEASRIIAELPESSFQACKDENEFNKKYSPQSAQRDCEQEFLD